MRHHTFIRLVSLCVMLYLMARTLKAAPIDAATAFTSLLVHEGFRSSPYRDPGPRKHWIVGLGHNLTANRQTRKASYTRDELMAFFDRDLAAALRGLRRDVPDFDGLPEDVQLVCLHLIWGVGPTGFSRFVNFRRALRHRFFNLAATEVALSKWHSQVSPERANWAVRTLRAQF